MPDREKVIKGLETIKQFFGYGLPSTAELFDSYCGTLNDALALIKEQEAKSGHWVVLENCSNAGVYCSECHTKMFDYYPMRKKLSQYCGHCGAKMTKMAASETKPKSTIEIIKDAGYVLVVRCDKCRMRDKTKMCHIWGKDVKDDDYCSYGKWKEGELDDHD